MIFKRLLSNLIDLLLYVVILFISLKLTGQELESIYLSFFYLVSFIATFIFPIVLLENTLGKKILKLTWKYEPNIKSKLLAKYSIYYLALAPTFSIFSAILSFPYLNPILKELNQSASIVLLVIYVITDVVVFLMSLGKFHILDYFLKLKIEGHDYIKNPFKLLGIMYLFFGLWFFTSIIAFKYDVSFKSAEKGVGPILYKEQYPLDLFYGNYVLTTKDYSENVFAPSYPLAFLHPKTLPQKTLYLNLPEQVFNSEQERRKICLNLVAQSLLNDFYHDFQPVQTRIVLSNFKRGFFFEQYYYQYTYYFDHQLPQWRVYGGFDTDTLTGNNYSDFIIGYNKMVLSRINHFEKKYRLSWKEIVEKVEEDYQFEEEIMAQYSSVLNATIYNNRVEIYLDTIKLELKKIEFSNTKLNGYLSYGFPFASPAQNIYSREIFDGKSMELDDDIEYLKLLRQQVVNHGM